jgi:hypothetical protein
MEPAPDANYQSIVRELRAEIVTFSGDHQTRHLWCYRIDNWFRALQILLTAVIAILAIFDFTLFAAILGIVVGIGNEIRSFFRLGEKAEHYRRVVAKAQNHVTELVLARDYESVLRIARSFEDLRLAAAAELPPLEPPARGPNRDRLNGPQ